jgi:hypothetical protein
VGRLNRPATWYLLWFDPVGGEPTVVRSEQPRQDVEYPPGKGMTQKINPADPPGVHLLLLVADTAGSDDATKQLKLQLKDVGKPPPALPPRWAVQLRSPGDTVPLARRIPSDYLKEVSERMPGSFEPIQAIFLEGTK